MKRLISIVIPVFNEAENIPVIYKEIIRIFTSQLPKYDYELILVDDSSTDASLERIAALASKDKRIAYIQFSKNFGKEIATTAGLHHSQGDAVIMLDADLQHPPKLIPEFIKKWEQGTEVVIGVRHINDSESFISRILGKLYYRLINAISDTPIIPQATDFRLLDRKVVTEFNRLTERDRMTRGLIDWLGFTRETISFTAPPRINGHQQYNGKERLKLAISSIVAHSLIPLKVAGYLGITITVLSGSLGLFILIEKYLLHDPWGLNFSGPAILAVILLFLTGITLACLGLMALYIGTIKTEISGRPLYVIRQKNIKTIR